MILDGIEEGPTGDAMMWSFAWQNLVTRPTRTALAVLGLTIPVLAFLGLFSLSGGIRHLMGDTLASMQNLMVLSENAPAPVFSDLPPGTGDALRKVPGVRVVAAEVWKVAPPIDGRGGRPGRGRARHADEAEGPGAQEPPQHDRHRGPGHRRAPQAQECDDRPSILPASKGGGRMLDESDIGKPHVVISTKIARDYPNADGRPRRSARRSGSAARTSRSSASTRPARC